MLDDDNGDVVGTAVREVSFSFLLPLTSICNVSTPRFLYFHYIHMVSCTGSLN